MFQREYQLLLPKNIEISNPGALIANNSIYRFSKRVILTEEIHGLSKALTLDTKEGL